MKSINIVVLLYVASMCMSTAQNYTFQITHEGLNRTFLVHTPCQSFPCHNRPLPVVMVFHGLGQTAAQIRDYSFFNDIADTAGFIVVYPQGNNNGWNVGFTIANPTSTNDVTFIEAIIQFLQANSNCTTGICAVIDTQSIFACGMSNGGFFSYHLACLWSHRIAGIASVTGSMTDQTYNNCQPIKPIPVLEIHGDADLVVPYTGSALSGARPIQHVLNFWRNFNGCPTNPAVRDVPDIVTTDSSTVKEFLYAPCASNTKILHYKVIGGGHCWPGSAQAPGLGPTNMDINASEEIWKFFKQFTTSSSTSISGQSLSTAISVYPNPASTKLIVLCNYSVSKTIEILDTKGKKIKTATYPPEDHLISLRVDHLPRGVYWLKYTDTFYTRLLRIMIEP